jgi:uncharacterized protein (DUF952 family)
VSIVYKILPQVLWDEILKAGIFDGSPFDLADGFIHFSTHEQAKETARLYFAGQDHLVLMAVDVAGLGDQLVFEPSRNGALFPHLYGRLTVSSVLWAEPLLLGADGIHIFPERF